MEIILVTLLGICAVYDLRSRTVPAVWVWGCLGSMLVYRLCLLTGGKSNIEETFICMLPGLVLIVFSYLGGQIGEGDGWLIIACGLCLSWENVIKGLSYAFGAAGIWGMGYLLFAHKRKYDKIPFIPSLFLGMVFVVAGEIL